MPSHVPDLVGLIGGAPGLSRDILTGTVEDAAFSGGFRSSEIGKRDMEEGETMIYFGAS